MKKQPKPRLTAKSKVIMPLVLKDLQDRYKVGIQRYGNPLMSFNGRDALWDAYEESLDLCLYLRQIIEEMK